MFAPFLKSALKDDRIVRGGFELGLWVSLGYYLQNIGVELTDAARASFISSFTIIAVPIIAGLSGRSVRSQTWIATAIAVAGLAMMEDLVSVPGLVDATTATAVADVVAGDGASLGVAADAATSPPGLFDESIAKPSFRNLSSSTDEFAFTGN